MAGQGPAGKAGKARGVGDKGPHAPRRRAGLGWAVVDQDNEAVGGLLWVGDNRPGTRCGRAPEEQITPI